MKLPSGSPEIPPPKKLGFLRHQDQPRFVPTIDYAENMYDLQIKRFGFFLELARVPKNNSGFLRPDEFLMPTMLSPHNPRFGEIGEFHSGSDPSARSAGQSGAGLSCRGNRPAFPGTFENYVASLISSWTSESSSKIRESSEDLKSLGLTWKIEAKPVNDTQVELRVVVCRVRSKGEPGSRQHRRRRIRRLADIAGVGCPPRRTTGAARLHRAARDPPPSAGAGRDGAAAGRTRRIGAYASWPRRTAR